MQKRENRIFLSLVASSVGVFFSPQTWSLIIIIIFFYIRHPPRLERLTKGKRSFVSEDDELDVRKKCRSGTKTARGAMRSNDIQIDVTDLTNTGLGCTCLQGPCKDFINKDRAIVKEIIPLFYGYEIIFFFFPRVLYDRSAVKHSRERPSLTFYLYKIECIYTRRLYFTDLVIRVTNQCWRWQWQWQPSNQFHELFIAPVYLLIKSNKERVSLWTVWLL